MEERGWGKEIKKHGIFLNYICEELYYALLRVVNYLCDKHTHK